MKDNSNCKPTTRTDTISANTDDYCQDLRSYVSKLHSQASVQDEQISHVVDGLDTLFNQKDGAEHYEGMLSILYHQNQPDFKLTYSPEQKQKAIDSIARSTKTCAGHSWRNWWRDSNSTWANRHRYSSQEEVFDEEMANQIFIKNLRELEIYLGYGSEEMGKFDNTLRTAKFPKSTVKGILTYGMHPFLDEKGCIEKISEGYKDVWTPEEIKSFKYHNPFSRPDTKESSFNKGNV